jgi:hypothetical protein
MGRPRRLRTLAAAAALVLAAFPASAACHVPAYDGDAFAFFAGIQPSDSFLDAWCRLYNGLAPGEYQASLVFSAPGRQMFEGKFRAERPFKLKIERDDPDPRGRMARLVQSVLPAQKDAQKVDANGQPFPKALEWTVQGTAASTPKAPEAQLLGLPPRFPGAKSYGFWMPAALKVWPVRLYGRDFALQIVFRPHVSRFIGAILGHEERFVLKGASDKALPFSDSSGCPSDRAPDCKDAGETIDMYAAWILDSITLSSLPQEGSLSDTAVSLASKFGGDLAERGFTPKLDSLTRNFSATEGRGKLQVQSATRELLLEATGSQNAASGTRSIAITWRERPNVNKSYSSWLNEAAFSMRDQIMMQYGGASGSRGSSRIAWPAPSRPCGKAPRRHRPRRGLRASRAPASRAGCARSGRQ